MGFDTPAGTRGGWQPGPGGPIGRWWTKRAMKMIRRKGRIMGLDALVLTTIGRRSGAERTVPVGWFPGGDGSWLILAAANGGARNPGWYYNIADRKVAAIAEQLHGTEREEAWRQITAAAPRFAKYQRKTDRELPIIRLTPRSG